MKYEDLKARFNQFSKCDETYVTIPREYWHWSKFWGWAVT